MTALLLCLGCSSACVSSETPASDLDSDALIVVERSKAQPPAWVKMPPGQLKDAGADLRLLTARSKLLNLPLGLKQTQLIGLDAMRSALAELAQKRLAALPGGASLAPPARLELEQSARRSADAVAATYAKINDLYYEALTNQQARPGDVMAHYYAVYILISYPKDKLPLLFRDLAKRLKAAKAAELRALAAAAAALANSAL